jgi:hypothetical protein
MNFALVKFNIFLKIFTSFQLIQFIVEYYYLQIYNKN